MTDKMVKLLSTWFYIGNLPVAPGTMASIVGAVMSIILSKVPLLYVFVLLVVTVLGFMVSGRMESILKQKDPGCVVIDEISGVMIAYFMLPVRWDIVIVTLFLFRAFDMFKIYPANKLEEMGGATGIMTDDIMAGVYTNIVMQLAISFSGIM